MSELTLLEKLIEADFGFVENGSRWGRSEDHDSLVLDRDKQVFYWNSEEIAGTALDYLIKVRGWTYRDSEEFLKQNEIYTGTVIHEYKKGEETVVYPKLVDIFHARIWKEDREYFNRRGITDDTISRFRLGYHNGFYTIPFYQDGIFKQFQLRKDSPKTIRNYYRGVGPLLYNSDVMMLTDKIIFVEGPTSCIVLNQNGFPCVSMNTGAEGFLEEWFPYFSHQKEIYLLFDNDKAGIRGALRTAKILGLSRCHLYNFQDFEEAGYDANDFFMDGHTKEEFKELLETSTKYAFEYQDFVETKRTKK